MYSRLRNRKRQKQSLSEKLDIGGGKYVHNVQFASVSESSNSHYVGSSFGSTHEPGSSWSDNFPPNMGRYVSKIQIPSIFGSRLDESDSNVSSKTSPAKSHSNLSEVDMENNHDNEVINVSATSKVSSIELAESSSKSGNHEEITHNKTRDETLTLHSVQPSTTIVDLTTDGTSSNEHVRIPENEPSRSPSAFSKSENTPKRQNLSSIDKHNLILSGRSETQNYGPVKLNFKELHEEYLRNWYKNHPPEEMRPMTLMEFIWTHCDGSDNRLGVDYGSDRSCDKKLKEIGKNSENQKPIRQVLAELDAKYEIEKQLKDSRIDSLLDTYDDNSFKSALSNQSLVDFFDPSQNNVGNVSPIVVDDASLSSSANSLKSTNSLLEGKSSSNEVATETNSQPATSANYAATHLVSKSYQLYIPDGFTELYHSSLSDEAKIGKLKQFEHYLTDSLLDEMGHYYPKSDNVKKDSLTNDISMDKLAFSSNFEKMFPKNRVFVNYLQLREAITEFMKHWNLLCKSSGKSFRCHYSHTPAKKKTITCDLVLNQDDTTNLKQSGNRQSTSSLVQCPFLVRWSPVDRKVPYRHDIFYKVKISTIVSLEHTCLMSHMSFRHALKTTSGHKKIDLNQMNTAVTILKMNPSMPAQMLRPLLKASLPSHTNLTAKFVDNFRKRVAIHHAKYPNQELLSLAECQALSKESNLSGSDYIGMNDPLVRTNLNTMYGKVMQTDNKVWSALLFLRKCKESISGFDFRILRSSAGNPTAILYMTSRMRYNLIRYGNIMFIDGQKRKYNKLNWPYIGPVIKNSDNRIGVTCEAIVTSEDIDTYTWIMKSMMSIEPRWSVNKLQILYADGLVTTKLLDNLGISDSCVLHGDYYHLFKENWPKPENFGSTLFRLVKPYLQKMVFSKTKLEWDNAFLAASEKLAAHPLKLELLQGIYTNPNYYAGYVTRGIVGNLSLNGTAPAEQNHASIVAHNGMTMLGSICDHIKALCERQQMLCNKENDLETDYLVRCNHYRPELEGEFGYEETIARKALSQVPHQNFFVKQLKSSQLLQKEYVIESSSHHVWPIGVSFDDNDENHITINDGDRCPCWRRVDYNIQCKHELCIEPKFISNKWGSRWLNRREFNRLYPNLSTFDSNQEIIDVATEVDNQVNVLENTSRTVNENNTGDNDSLDEVVCLGSTDNNVSQVS